jgi:hypothetical protein
LFQNQSQHLSKKFTKITVARGEVSFKIVTKDKSQQQIDEILIKLANLVMIA